jgi:hypothetical protein
VLAAAMQRRFVHVKIEQSGSAALLPTILIFQSEDVALLNAEFNKTLEVRVSDLWSSVCSTCVTGGLLQDLLWILKLHAGSVLPLSGCAEGPTYSPTPLDPKTGVKKVYHGNFISASFTIREAESNYAVMLLGGASGSDSASSLGRSMKDMPVAGYRLHAHIRHKDSELSRRKAQEAKAIEESPLFNSEHVGKGGGTGIKRKGTTSKTSDV